MNDYAHRIYFERQRTSCVTLIVYNFSRLSVQIQFGTCRLPTVLYRQELLATANSRGNKDTTIQVPQVHLSYQYLLGEDHMRQTYGAELPDIPLTIYDPLRTYISHR